MDLYNLFVSGEKIYRQIQKSPSELTYEDYLLMMDPFFISENDIVEVERKKKRSKRGGSEEAGSGDGEASSGDGEASSGDGDDGGDDFGDDDGDSEEGGKKKKGFLSKLMKGDLSELSDEELAEEEAKLLEQDTENMENEGESSEENEEKKDKDKKNALKEFKGNIGTFLKYFVLLLFIGGGPLLIWFVIMYHTFKRLRTTYKWMIEPM